MERLNAFTDWLAKVSKGVESVLGVGIVLGALWFGLSWLGDKLNPVLEPFRWVGYVALGALLAFYTGRAVLDWLAERIALRVAARLRDGLDIQDPHGRPH
jgi:hypothetical protein